MPIVGWRRVASDNPCEFCAMLVSRGAFYSEEGADFEAHDGCTCTAEPVWQRETEPAEVQRLREEFDRVAGGLSGKAALAAWRKHWRGRAFAQPGAGGATGSRAASLTIRPSLEAARTSSAVGRVFMDEFERITGSRPRFVDFQGSASTAREHAEGMLRALERFPGVKLESVGTFSRDSAYAHAQGSAIRFNYDWTKPSERKAYLESLAGGTRPITYGGITRPGFHPAGTGSPIGVAAHEFGHVLDLETLGQSIRSDLERLLRTRAKARDVTLRARVASGERILDDYGVKGLVEAEISAYALKNRTELVAEAFADAVMNGPNASPLSQEIFALLEAAYRRIAP